MSLTSGMEVFTHCILYYGKYVLNDVGLCLRLVDSGLQNIACHYISEVMKFEIQYNFISSDAV